MYSQYSSRHSRRGRRKKKSALYTNFHCDPDPWQGSPPQTPPSSDDEQPAPVSVARNSSLRQGAAVAKAVAVAPTLSTKNRGRRINSVKRKISKYVKMQNANDLHANRQPTRPQCTAPVPLPLFVKKKKTKKTAPVPMPHHFAQSKSKSKPKSKKKLVMKRVPRTERRAKAKRENLCKPSMKIMQQQIAQMSMEKKAKKQKRLVTANAPRNPNPISIPKPRPSPPPPKAIQTQTRKPMPMPIPPTTAIPTPPRIEDDSENIDFGLIPDAYFIGYSHDASLATEAQNRSISQEPELDLMDINITEIQNLKDLKEKQHTPVFAAKPKEHLSPQSNGSLSGAEIIVNCCVSGQSGHNSANGFLQHQDSYNVLSDLTDFSISDGSHKNIEMELEREIEIEMELEPLGECPIGVEYDLDPMASVSKMDLDRIEMRTVGIDEGDENEDFFGDEKFNMLAQEIMFETEHPTQPIEPPIPSKRQQPPSFQMPPYQPYSQFTAGSSSQDYSYRYQCPVTTNIWAEPKRAQSAQTLAGLLMNGLEPISTKMFTL